MNTRTCKIAFLMGLYVALHFFEACRNSDGSNCACPDSLPFFDYAALKITTKENPVVDYFSMEVQADSVSYLTTVRERSGFGLINSAWACSCLWDGHDGPKYRVEKFNIYADRAFNDTLLAGASLNPIFFANGGDVLILLAPDEPFDYFWAFGDGAEAIRPLKLSTFEKPAELGVPFRFLVEMIKTNGDTLRAQTGEIVFQ
ncbi:MAG: hypothetical protein ACKVUS_03630 [Saprospiraceae bacterium]